MSKSNATVPTTEQDGPAQPAATAGQTEEPTGEPAEEPTGEQAPETFEVGDQWVFLIDPAWQAKNEEDRPPLEAVVGGWYVEKDGSTGRFHCNPSYEPSSPDAPTDPVDATMRLVVRGEMDADALLSTMRESEFGIAVDEENTPVVAPAPDDVPSVLVTTAPAHRHRVTNVAGWAELSLSQLVELLPEEGIDVLLNPGAPESMRLITGALREMAAAEG